MTAAPCSNIPTHVRVKLMACDISTTIIVRCSTLSVVVGIAFSLCVYRFDWVSGWCPVFCAHHHCMIKSFVFVSVCVIKWTFSQTVLSSAVNATICVITSMFVMLFVVNQHQPLVTSLGTLCIACPRIKNRILINTVRNYSHALSTIETLYNVDHRLSFVI